MDGDMKIFVLLMVGVCVIAWVINNWIRAKHGYPLENSMGTGSDLPIAGKGEETERLKAENAELHSKLDAMQDRMIVLEKIVTDRGYSLSEEIEALRDAPAPASSDMGVPLNLDPKETT